MAKRGIFVVGALHYDIIVGAPYLPARDETVIGGPLRFVCGGKGGNQAVAASHHGAYVAFGGMVGDDEFGNELKDHLRNAGVDVAQVRSTRGAPSGASVAIVEHSGDYGAVVASGANMLIDSKQIFLPKDTSWLVLQNEIPESINLMMAEQAHKAGIKVILNAAPWRPLAPEILELIDILVVNRIEAEGLLGQAINSRDDVLSALGNRDLCIPHVVVTLGSDGLVYRGGSGLPQHVAGIEVVTISSHGAGDVFVGAMCSELARGETYTAAIAYAGAAAALHVSMQLEERMSIGRDQTLTFMAASGAK